MNWRSLNDWRQLDGRLKARLDRPFRFRGIAPDAVAPWLAYQLALALGVPLTATPLVTWMLYPWLPQPHAWIYLTWGMAALLLSAGARRDYMLAQQRASTIPSGPIGKMSTSHDRFA